MQVSKKRNGEIDLLRFIFSIIIVFFHFNLTLRYSKWNYGYIGVEFFFIVSGFLMAKNAYIRQKNFLTGDDIANLTWQFTIRKVTTFFRYYFFAILILLVVGYIIIWQNDVAKIVRLILRSIPTVSLTFIGLNNNSASLYVASTWYLSALVLASFILYPILLKQYSFTVKIVMPLISVFIIGYLYATRGTISDWQQWNGFCYVGLLRAIAELSLGASLVPLSEWLTKNINWMLCSSNLFTKIVVTMLKALCYIVVFVYAYGLDFGGHYTLHALLFCALGILLSFCNAGYVVPDCKLTRYLGKISLPIYVFHGLLRWFLPDVLAELPTSTSGIVAVIIAAILVSIMLMYVTDGVCVLMKRIWSKKNKPG